MWWLMQRPVSMSLIMLIKIDEILRGIGKEAPTG